MSSSALLRLTTRSTASSAVHIQIMSLSGYTTAPAGAPIEENIATRAGDSPSFRTKCAPSGPEGKKTTSHGSSRVSPAGWRSVVATPAAGEIALWQPKR